MRQFLISILKFSSIGAIAVLLISASYFMLDPFRVIKSYDDYSKSNFVTGNKDFISTAKFLKNVDVYHYNSFIFGSSRTLAYDPLIWQQKLDGTTSPFVFDASSESIYGIYTKIKYLDSMNIDLENVMIVICKDHTFKSSHNPKNHIRIKHPEISGESPLAFQMMFFKAFWNLKFLKSYSVYLLSGRYFPFMEGYINLKNTYWDPVTNHMILVDDETLLAQGDSVFYNQKRYRFYKTFDDKGFLIHKVVLPQTATKDSLQTISVREQNMLNEIKQILVKHHTNYKVILHPLLEKVKFSDADYAILNGLFEDHLYDFTGDNEFTRSITDYYDWSHCRPHIGEKIMDIVYGDSPNPE